MGGTNKVEKVSNSNTNVAHLDFELPTTQHCVSIANIDFAARRDAREREILAELIVQQEQRLSTAKEEAAETARQEASAETEVAALRTRRDEVESYWRRLDGVRQETHVKRSGSARSTLHDEQPVLEDLLARHRSEKALCHAELSNAEHEVAKLAPERTTAKITPMQEAASSGVFAELRRCLEEIDELKVQLEPVPYTSGSSRARSCAHVGQFAALAERELHHKRRPGYDSSSQGLAEHALVGGLQFTASGQQQLQVGAGPFGERIGRTGSTRLHKTDVPSSGS